MRQGGLNWPLVQQHAHPIYVHLPSLPLPPLVQVMAAYMSACALTTRVVDLLRSLYVHHPPPLSR